MNTPHPRTPHTELRAQRRDGAGRRVRRMSRVVAIVATGGTAVLGLLVARQIPGVSATVHAPAVSTNAGAATTSGSSGGGSSTTGSSTTGSSTTTGSTGTTTTTTTTPSSTSQSATVVSGGSTTQ
jgi:cytoskeletal protein RodZ